MGTRGITKVIIDGEVKVAQYGQWDHYPDGVGLDVLNFLAELSADGLMDEFKEKVRALEGSDEVSPEAEEWFEQNAPGGWMDMSKSKELNELFPQYSRDTGPDILKLIQEEKVSHVQLDTEFEKDRLWCEGIATVDLDNNTYSFDAWKTVHTWPLSNLPTPDEFLGAYDEKAEND